ncbi:MAG: RagB/SusD family nutrient uptake outer membrane protein [Candidatus Pseudobacter hemicellulosilyticus]|uniref:RagB/SusD family nutrient uptake outer membrane protein n=1 Tax=Candidatus Pseudobacter hemicellulosilyticus TaxID=3121375 RepID=A0AAJ5WQV3_9BACT|nr:MAG: RagB/SusD family nutrient uptake outer membrane protein [Pseudobacter sp.]
MNANKFRILLCLPLLMSISCKKFLDVSARDQVLQEKMFEDGNGIRIAVNGVYKLLSHTDLYGKNLTWGFASALGSNYEYFNLPYRERDAAQYLWQSSNVQALTEQVWKRAYNTLANCNNLIQEVEQKDSLFFEQRSREKNMILGEMYGVRAMLHFDLLRIFSPAPVTGYNGATIPYVAAYPEYQPAPLNMQALLTSIETDLQKARSLLAPVDTIWLRGVMRSNVGRIRSNGSWVPLDQGDFFNFRAQRMNYFAATALLARLYLYKQDDANAYTYAKLMYDAQKANWFRWTSASYQGQITDVDFIHTKRPEELMLCFANNLNYVNIETTMDPNVGANYWRMSSGYMNALFAGDLDDYRIVGWYNRYNDQRYITWLRPKGNSYTADQVAQDQGPLLPAIRFTEMYHILIECLIRQEKIEEAVTILNDLRTNRGAKVKIANSVSGTELMEVLVKDIIRETLVEGQTFFLFKRLNRNIFNGATDRIMLPGEWYAPLPQSEVAYQL